MFLVNLCQELSTSWIDKRQAAEIDAQLLRSEARGNGLPGLHTFGNPCSGKPAFQLQRRRRRILVDGNSQRKCAHLDSLTDLYAGALPKAVECSNEDRRILISKQIEVSVFGY